MAETSRIDDVVVHNAQQGSLAPGADAPADRLPSDVLLDEMAIRNVVARLALLADLGSDDFVEYLGLWTEDGVYDVREPVGWQPDTPSQAKIIAGHAALIEDRRMLRSTGFQGPGTDVWHLNTTLWVNVKDAVTAEAESLWVLVDGNGAPGIRRVGHYHDSFRKLGGSWKLAHRIVTPNGS